ncbi:ubiquitin-conjugating enzyme/RWD-like protein [Amanita rubescens]|nr:ubiquitin-conjugating enzyme/RWD-like protein [Amanita rubescens]
MPNPTLAVTQATVALEYASLRNKGHCPLGMYIVPAAQSLLCWDSVFFVHRGASSGHYAGAILKFHVNFPWNYPERPPVVQFVTDIFHPLIGPDGTLSMAPRFRPWRPKEHTVFHVLAFVKIAFSTDGLSKFKEADCANKEAFKKSPASFEALARQSAMLSQSDSALFDSDHPSLAGKVLDGITFKELTRDQLGQVRAKCGLQKCEQVDK